MTGLRPRRQRLETDPAAGGPGRRVSVRIDGAAKQAVEVGRTRLVVAGTLFALAFAIIGLRLFDLMVLRGGAEPSLASTSGKVVVTAERASIVDRNGVLLATNLKTASLYAEPRRVMDAADSADKLVAVLPGLDRDAVLAKLTSGRSFVWLKRNLTPRQQYEVNRLGLPGLSFQSEERRVYPHGALFAHVLGFTDVDNRGLSGVEKYFDNLLRDPGRDGRPLQLSVDVRVQHALRQEMMYSMAKFRAKGGAGLVLDVRSGEVIAMVSLPDFDPNRIQGVGDAALFNRATLGVYEMGSTFKAFTLAMALDTGTVNFRSGYDASKPIRISRFVIRDYRGKGRWLSVPEIFMYSSNIGAAKMAMDVGAARQREFLGRFGLLERLPIELPEVGTPLVPARWGDVTTMTVSYGHGIAVTPLQLAAGVGATVNGGIMIPPTLVKRADGDAVPGRRVISAKTSASIRRLMRLVVSQGTASKARVPGYLVGGKTGTADKPFAGGYRDRALISSFVGAFPMNAPQYLVLAVLDEPRGTKETFNFATGGWTAAPLVGRVISRIGPLLGVEPVDENARDVRKAMYVNLGKEKSLAAF